MLFNSFTYIVFLPLVVAIYWLSPRASRRRILLLASYVFYMNWLPVYGLLLASLTTANYFLGIGIGKHTNLRKQILTLGCVINVGCLCYYKYANFLVDSLYQSGLWLVTQTGMHLQMPPSEPVLNIILPLGISFFVFEFMHYLVDVYRGSKPITNFEDFALFAAFFPSQIAGPIKRFQDFIEQVHAQSKPNRKAFEVGLSLIVLGLFKKIVLADNLGAVIDAGFNHIDKVGTLDSWIAVCGFMPQVFFDFSGYTDIGRGSAMLLGYQLPPNFNFPFLSVNMAEFWRRWHISLSTWLRDYVYISLGGSRNGTWATKRNIFLTMLIGGLWHGASWHYVIWGGSQGLAIILTKDWQDTVTKLPWLAKWRAHRLWHITGVGITFLLISLNGLLFRANSIPDAIAMGTKLFILAPSAQVLDVVRGSPILYALGLYFAFLIIEWLFKKISTNPNYPFATAISRWWHSSIPAQVVAYTAAGIVILGFAPGKAERFVYFQF